MRYKYQNVVQVVAKRDFEVPQFDENGELVGMAIVPKGCKGVIESMGPTQGVENRVDYDICFTQGKKEVFVALDEEDMGLYLELHER